MATPDARASLAALLALALAGCSRPAGAPPASSPQAALDPARPLPSPVPDVVARVNGRAVRVQQILPLAKTELDRLPNDERQAKMPEVVRRALQQYVDRELLLQEALARGVQADSAEVDWAYDQLRHEHPDDRAWADFLASQGMSPQALRAELRVQRTVAALLEQEVKKTLGEGADETVRQQRQAEIGEALLARLRAKARIELFL